MTRVTTDGSEMRDRCPASTSVMWAPARLAMNVSSAGGMIWSPEYNHAERFLAQYGITKDELISRRGGSL